MAQSVHSVDLLLEDIVPRLTPAAQLVIRQRGTVVYDRACGWLDPSTHTAATRRDTLFDLASVTKLFVVTAFMRLVEADRVQLERPLADVLGAWHGERTIAPYEDPLQSGTMIEVDEPGGRVDAGSITFRQVITHSAGLPAWRPLFRQGSREVAIDLAMTTQLAYRPGTQVVYSDIGLILLGISIERLTGITLDAALQQLVIDPLGLQHTCYLPIGAIREIDNVAPTEICAWRGRRIKGEVHDENAASLGGVSGHAGLFSTASDVAAFGQTFLDHGQPLLRPECVAEMVREQVAYRGLRRGLGFALWSPDPEASSNPLSPESFGHTGFTGTSLWIDPRRDLVVALLTNEVYGGRHNRSILKLRVDVHRAIIQAFG